jgi:hypothetical protein
MVIRSFDDNLMRPDPTHLVKHTFSDTSRLSLNLKGGKFVGHNSNPPPWLILLRGSRPVAEDFGWGIYFVTRAKRTESFAFSLFAFDKSGGPFCALGCYDHPPTDYRVFAQFGHFALLILTSY